MKTWFGKIFGKEQKQMPLDGSKPAPAIATAEQTVLPDTEQTIVASPPNDLQALHAVEAQVAAEWKVGDVILDLYEVKHIHEGGGMGLVYRVHHRGWNMDLAVKIPRSDYFQDGSAKGEFHARMRNLDQPWPASAYCQLPLCSNVGRYTARVHRICTRAGL